MEEVYTVQALIQGYVLGRPNGDRDAQDSLG